MTTIEIDDDIAELLCAIAAQEKLSTARLLKNMLGEWLEDRRDAERADIAYQHYLDSKKTHSLADVVKELGLDS